MSKNPNWSKKADAYINSLPPDPRQQNLFGTGCDLGAPTIESTTMSTKTITHEVPKCDSPAHVDCSLAGCVKNGHPDCDRLLTGKYIHVTQPWTMSIFRDGKYEDMEVLPVGDFHPHHAADIAEGKMRRSRGGE